MPTRPLVTYIRVSTSRQGRSGLGMEAQRAALARFAETEGYAQGTDEHENKMRTWRESQELCLEPALTSLSWRHGGNVRGA
jgi:DNA invertase Pin-like site-specific DNA recombinase